MIEQAKLTFFFVNKVYDRKESSLANYYCIRRKLKVFFFFLSSTLNVCLYDIAHYAFHRITEITKWKRC